MEKSAGSFSQAVGSCSPVTPQQTVFRPAAVRVLLPDSPSSPQPYSPTAEVYSPTPKPYIPTQDPDTHPTWAPALSNRLSAFKSPVLQLQQQLPPASHHQQWGGGVQSVPGMRVQLAPHSATPLSAAAPPNGASTASINWQPAGNLPAAPAFAASPASAFAVPMHVSSNGVAQVPNAWDSADRSCSSASAGPAAAPPPVPAQPFTRTGIPCNPFAAPKARTSVLARLSGGASTGTTVNGLSFQARPPAPQPAASRDPFPTPEGQASLFSRLGNSTNNSRTANSASFQGQPISALATDPPAGLFYEAREIVVRLPGDLEMHLISPDAVLSFCA